jgi:23S rRNA (guanosine2251-2'-O)-methyltransferase
MTKEQFYIIGGKHAVIESIKNSKRYIKTIFANSEKNYQLIKSINQRNIKIELALGTSFNKLFIDKEFVHQGFAALVSPLENLDLETFIQSDLENKKRSVFIILDGIEDDRNIGSIIRSSSALGADGIIINKREFRNKSFHMHKTASGAMEYIPIFAVSNVVNAIDILKKNNFWIYAMDGKANNSIFKEKFSTKVSFVFGSESDGMRKIVLNHSDNILFIPMKNKIDSLNVSNAVAATLAIYNSIK